jgi:hypothetical protein
MPAGNASTRGSAGCYDHHQSKPVDVQGARGPMPLKFFDDTLQPKSNRPTPTQTAGAETRSPRPGTRQRGFGKSDE